MSSIHPATRGESGWGEARLRGDAYLTAMGFASEKQRERIVHAVLREAAIKHAGNLQEKPVTLVMNLLLEFIEQWADKLGSAEELAAMRGPVLLYAVDGPGKWPAFLFASEIPENFLQAVSECRVVATPDLNISRMVPQPFDNALLDITLPTAVGKLTRDLSPSFFTKVAALVWAGVALISGNRLR